jgi:hypothetical protein
MKCKMTTTSALGALALGVGLTGCDGFTGGAGDKPEGFRLIEGRLSLPDEDLLGRQVTGLQVAALHLDADGGITAFTSSVFDPSTQRAEAAFVATVPGDLDVVLVLQVPSGSQRGPGPFLGAFDAAGERLVPRGEDDLELGVLTVQRGVRVPADTTLVGGAGALPAAQTDSDGDGLTNDRDDDDDGDDVADGADDDVAGDGVADALQRLDALPDDDGNGVPDALE